MPNEKILYEVFVIDPNGVSISCGKHQTEIENYTYVLNVPKDSQNVAQIKLVFYGKVQP